ncbi:MAG TPA: outer membrane protein assembly factor BamA [Gemmata sp.]|nr:outer membrane protein assembly factor BamA [Gemmata sp.]
MLARCLDRRMWVLLLVFSATGAWWIGTGLAADNPNGKIISEVITVNNYIRKKEDILAIMLSRPGTAYEAATAQEDVRRLQATKWFVPGSIQINTMDEKDGRVKVFVYLNELRSTVEDIQFIGAQHLGKNELQTLSGVRKGEPMNTFQNIMGQKNILKKYHEEEGRSYATVELIEGGLPTDTRVIYQIVEGPVVKVGDVEFRGVVRAIPGRLREQIMNKPELGFIPPKFKPFTLDIDRLKLIEYYHSLGYLGVQITPEVVHTADIGKVNIVYHIVEGIQYVVAAKQIDGNRSFPTPTLEGLTELQPGDPYDRRKAELDIKRMKDYMGERGYQVAVEQKLYEVPGQTGLVQVNYEVVNDTGTPKRVGRVMIEGNSVTQDRVILNQIPLRSGQILEYPQVEIAKARLARLGIFDPDNPPTVEVVPNEWDSVYQDVIVRVKETRTGQFMVGGSVNSDMGLSGNVTINERNFDILRWPTSWDDIVEGRAWRGGGQEFRIEAVPGIEFQRYSVTWREPYLFDTPFALTVSGYYNEFQYAEYFEDLVGLRVTLDRRLDQYWTASLSTRIEGVDITNVPYWAPQSIAGDKGDSYLVGVRAGLSRDTRDSVVYPTKGNVFNIGIEQVFGTQQFPIGTVEFTQFFSNKYFARDDGSGQQVLCLRSLVEVEGGNAPVYERFYGGGIRSFRGFEFRGVGPFQNDLAVGGNFAWLNTIEYQVPLLTNDKVQGVIFCDHGTVEQNFAIHNYRVAIGAGIRVSLPMLGPLPLALDFAIPLNQAPQDKKQLVNFSMGYFGGPGH